MLNMTLFDLNMVSTRNLFSHSKERDRQKNNTETRISSNPFSISDMTPQLISCKKRNANPLSNVQTLFLSREESRIEVSVIVMVGLLLLSVSCFTARQRNQDFDCYGFETKTASTSQGLPLQTCSLTMPLFHVPSSLKLSIQLSCGQRHNMALNFDSPLLMFSLFL